MTNKEMEELTARIQEKIGKEASGLIADDLGLLISDTSKVNQDYFDRTEEISKLKEQKEKLIETNGNLLQQITMGEESPKRPQSQEMDEEISISWNDCFDSKRKFLEINYFKERKFLQCYQKDLKIHLTKLDKFQAISIINIFLY